MSNDEKNMRSRIHRLEDDLFRCKNFQEQVRMSQVLNGYRRKLQSIIWENQKNMA